MKSKISSIFWFLFLVLYLEIVYKIFVFHNLFSLNTLSVIFFTLPITLFFYILLHVFNKKINFFLNIIFTFLITLLFCAQMVYFRFYESLFSMFSIRNGTGQILDFVSTIGDIMLQIWYVLIITSLPLIFFLIFGKKVFSFKRLKKIPLMIVSIVMLLLYSSSLLIVKKSDEGIYSLKRLYHETHAPVLTANKMGLLTTTKLDLKRYLFGFEEKVWVPKNDNKSTEKEIEPITYNVLDIDFANLIANEPKENIKNMHMYFSNVEPTQKNEYTGMFKGKNLIYITAEGLDEIAIDPELTPTLYKMANNGIVFKNYYQPMYISTTDGEYMVLTGLLPKEGVWSAYRSSFISMPFTIGNMFKKLGYKTNAYHNHTYTYYDRNKSHPNMGFDFQACGNGLEKRMNCKRWPNSDYEMVEATYTDYINEEVTNFATYYMTVSGHLNYNFYGNNMASRNKSLVSHLPYSDAVKAFIACNMEFDKAMEALLAHLEEAGKLDDTLIVISPDHYPYGLKVNELNEKSSINRDDKFDLYKTRLIMYNPKLENIVVNKYAASIDILPTVYNLFGVDYDSRLLIGRDLLSPGEGLVIFSNRSWITDKGRYNSISKEFTLHKGQTIEEGYVDKINTIVYQKFSMSSLILTTDYYSKLGL